MINKKKFKQWLSAFLVVGSLFSVNPLPVYATPSTYYSNSNIRYGFDNNNKGHFWVQTGSGYQILYGTPQSASYPYLSVNGGFYNLANIDPTYIDNGSVSSGIITKSYSAQAGVVTSMRLSPVNNGNYVKYEITLTNNNSYAVNAGYKEYWDTQVGGNDSSPIEYLSTANGFRMYNGSTQLTLLAKNTFNVTNVTSFWAGSYSYGRNSFDDVSFNMSPGDTFSAGDSALYFKWAESSLPAYSSRTYSVIVGAGALNKNPVQNATSPISNQYYSSGQTIYLQGSMSDPDGVGVGLMNLSYGIDGGSQVSLPGVADSSTPYNYNYPITLPSNMTPGSHTLNVFVTDKEGGVSAVQNITFNVSDSTPPNLTLNPSTTAWTNGNVSITASGTDNIGVTQIQTPAGWVNGSSTTYTVGANGTYSFVAKDGAGNLTPKSITVSNIDKTVPAITFTKSPSTWTKGAVTVTATATDTGSGVVSMTKPDNTVVSGNTATYTVSSNGTLTFKATDSAGNISTQTVSVSNIDTSTPTASLSVNNSAWTNQPVTITATGTDTGGSGVSSITTPGGNIVNASSASYIVSANGTYTFTVTDSAGNVGSQSINITNIDTAPPTLSVTPSTTSWINGSVVLTATGSDTSSGVKSITLPNGTVFTGASTTYSVSANGTYNFVVTDNAGNTSTKSITVNNIDTGTPSLNLTQNPTAWTSGNVTITATGTDTSSGVKSITLPDGSVVYANNVPYTVTTNGTYSFVITDNVGITSTKSITVSNIDKTPPTLTLSQSSTQWTNGLTTINVTAIDNGAGIKQIVLPNGNIVTGNTASFTVPDVGVYYFNAIDNVGNTATSYIVVANIDKEKPTVTVTNNQNWSNASGIAVTVSATDK